MGRGRGQVERAERVHRSWEEEEIPGWGPAKPANLELSKGLDGYLGLEPFVFDPGEVPTQEALRKQAEDQIRDDKSLKETLRARKAEITEILQDCLDRVNDQLERGEEICRKAHFPLLHPFDFEDFEALATHDFTIDLHADVVDKALQNLLAALFEILWKHISVENERGARMLEAYNEALQARMTTLEHHLRDRSKQLSNCRFTYFLEITHLRNQVYIKHREGEKFEAVEAYFFDPSEFLEEGLRQQLNDMITQSVAVKDRHFKEAKQIIEELESKLAAASEAFDPSKCDNLVELLQVLCRKHTEVKAVKTLGEIAEKEMGEWAAMWAEAHGLIPLSSVDSLRQQLVQAENYATETAKELEDIRCQLRRSQQEADNAHGEARRLEKTAADLRDALEAEEASRSAFAGAGAVQQADPASRVSPASRASSKQLYSPEAMDELRLQIVDLEGTLAKDRARLQELERQLAEAKNTSEEHRKRSEGYLAQLQVAPRGLEDAQGVTPIGGTDLPELHVLSDADRKRLLEHGSSLRRAHAFVEEFSELDSLASGAAADIPAASKSSGGKDVDARQLPPEGLEDCVEWLGKSLRAAVDARHSAELQAADAKRAAEETSATLAASAEHRLAQAFQKAKKADEARIAELQALLHDAELRSNNSSTGGGRTFSKRTFSAPTGLGGAHSEVQTNITAHGDGGFYLLEVPPSEGEIAIQEELEDLNACALSNWATTLEQIRSCLRPPLGTGNGFCARGCFIRLFQGARQRLVRHDELIAMVEDLKRAELHQVVEGVHLLMESTLPDEDSTLRDVIFGRGFTETNLNGSKGLEFAELTKRWSKLVARIVSELLKSRRDIRLGAHLQRRTFIPGGAAGGASRINVEGLGGAGGGLMSRQRKDFSPSREHFFDGLLSDDEEGPLFAIGTLGGSERPRISEPNSSDDEGDLRYTSLLGKAMFPTAIDAQEKDDVRTVPAAAGLKTACGAAAMLARKLGRPRSHGGRPNSAVRRPASSGSSRPTTAGGTQCARSEVSYVDFMGEELATGSQLAGAAADFHDATSSQARPGSAPHSRTVTNAASDTAGFRNADTVGALTRPGTAPPRAGMGSKRPTEASALPIVIGDIEEPQAEPAPGENGVGTPIRQLGRSRSGPALAHRTFDAPLFAAKIYSGHDNTERALERERRKICAGGTSVDQPLPTWEFERREEQKARPIGGKHTMGFLRPALQERTGAHFLGEQRRPSTASRMRAYGRTSSGSIVAPPLSHGAHGHGTGLAPVGISAAATSCPAGSRGPLAKAPVGKHVAAVPR